MADVAAQIDEFLKKQGSPLEGLGNVFVAAGKKYGVDPKLMVAISGAESSFGQHTYGEHNAWGWGPGIDFPNWENAITSIAKGLRTGYLNQGLTTPAAISRKWAPAGAANDPTGLNANWTGNVIDFMSQLGAAPSASAASRVANATAAATQPARTLASAVPKIPEFDPTPIITSGGGYSPEFNIRRLVGGMLAHDEAAQAAQERTQARTVPPTTKPKPTPPPSAPPPPPKGRRLAGTDFLQVGDANISRVDPNLLSAVNALGEYLGKPITINSGWRSQAEQAALYQRYVNSGYDIRYIAAKPGQSNHQRGDALDLSIDGVPITNAVPAATLRRFGLHTPVKGDLPHTTLLSVSG